MDQNRPLGDGDYDDGEIHPLVPGSELDQAIRNEAWLNYPEETRDKWIRLMDKDSVVFIGTVISIPRRQIEMTIVLQVQAVPERRWMTSVMITLDNFDRFSQPPAA